MSDHEQPALFDPGPARERPVDPPLSATRRLTERNRDLLKDGVHPATLRRLLAVEEDGRQWTCGTCRFAVVQSNGNRSYWKCQKHRLGITNGAATDIRRSWPACALWERP